MPTKKRVGLAVFELFFGLVALGALATENVMHIKQGTYNFLDTWSYFTYESNLIAMVALLVSAYAVWNQKEWRLLDKFRGAATLYMIVTGIVYATLVHNASPAVWWDNNIMHQVIPIVMVIAWIWDRPKWFIPNDSSAMWLIYPVLYAVYTQIHGWIIRPGDYVYAFLNPQAHGYLFVGGMVLGLTIAAAVVARVLTHLSLIFAMVASLADWTWARLPLRQPATKHEEVEAVEPDNIAV